MTVSPPSRRKRDGSLRRALVDAGVALLRERGPDKLSLRECAAKAGVSHAAPGYHFKNITGLSTAIAARGFALFCEAMEKRLETCAPAAAERLSAICQGYLDFATGHPELFLFIFSGQKFNENDEEFALHASRSYAILRETCAPLIPEGTDPEEIEILVWSLVHGYAHLAMTRKKENPGLGPGWPDFSTIIGHLHKALPVSG
ncbi:TetR/AcrR family transcriptional regulator [Roseibium aggregatum]|jgi:AcrR family transcriptional regulator|uniref:Putative TetR-family transcriptional regulator n=1 Tax=Roseibium aggregatum (strain ATCC 25650 / DSM 13394 / JCM 20685 / NBRC 16684 / NCIMB 2208 / IAM 12614 / B1) TaxID=384765 RepID=A0NW89_ROSAI|nr:TetR/AcrR family transcriptional regulator [Roseibium aggregatum]EAV42805.1 putative TetR-family transcriptional regulator [Stappia aggregata IAM 12614] [Roseibium aggregatum IAM 12614]